MSDRNLRFGHQGEQAAAALAAEKGYALIEANYRTPYGEIDLILRSPEGIIVFAEVKSRTSIRYGYPETAVNARKKEHIVRSAYYYIHEKYPFGEDVPWRVDILALIYSRDKTQILDFRWFENVTADD